MFLSFFFAIHAFTDGQINGQTVGHFAHG